MRALILAFGLMLSPACAGPDELEFLASQETQALGLPFSDAVRAGNLLFVSGQIGNRPGSLDVVDGGIRNQARQALENIRTILERNGSSLDRVAKCTVFLADIAEWAAFNEVYVTFFPIHPPARSALAASGLAAGARVEVECIALAGASSLLKKPASGSPLPPG